MMEVQSMKDNVSINIDGTPDPMLSQSITVFNLVKLTRVFKIFVLSISCHLVMIVLI